MTLFAAVLAQDVDLPDHGRKVAHRVMPGYPELAKQMRPIQDRLKEEESRLKEWERSLLGKERELTGYQRRVAEREDLLAEARTQAEDRRKEYELKLHQLNSVNDQLTLLKQDYARMEAERDQLNDKLQKTEMELGRARAVLK